MIKSKNHRIGVVAILRAGQIGITPPPTELLHRDRQVLQVSNFCIRFYPLPSFFLTLRVVLFTPSNKSYRLARLSTLNYRIDSTSSQKIRVFLEEARTTIFEINYLLDSCKD